MNVRDPAFGARGDGTSSDSAAVQTAIDAAASTGGGIVYIPRGDYPVAVEVKDSVHLWCQQGTILRADGHATPVRLYGTGSSLRNGTITGTFRADPKRARSSHCIDVRGSNVVVENTVAGGSRYDSLYVRAEPGGVVFRDCRFSPTARNTASIVRGRDITFERCSFTQDHTFRTAEFNGLYLFDVEPNRGDSVTGLTVVGCTFQNNLRDGYAGILLQSPPRTGALGQDDHPFRFVDCHFQMGRHLPTTIRPRGTEFPWGLLLMNCRFDGHVFTSPEVITLRRSVLVGNRHTSPSRFAYNVKLGDVVLAHHSGGGWDGLVTSPATILTE